MSLPTESEVRAQLWAWHRLGDCVSLTPMRDNYELGPEEQQRALDIIETQAPEVATRWREAARIEAEAEALRAQARALQQQAANLRDPQLLNPVTAAPFAALRAAKSAMEAEDGTPAPTSSTFRSVPFDITKPPESGD